MNAYLSHILETLGDHDPIMVLEATPARLEGIFEALQPWGFDTPYAPGKWNAREIFAHMGDVELGLGFRFRQVISEPAHIIQPFDQDAWATRYPKFEPSLALETFRALRAWNLSLFRTFTLEDFLAEAHHPERGLESVDLMIRFLAGHDLNHLAQLDKLTA